MSLLSRYLDELKDASTRVSRAQTEIALDQAREDVYFYTRIVGQLRASQKRKLIESQGQQRWREFQATIARTNYVDSFASNKRMQYIIDESAECDDNGQPIEGTEPNGYFDDIDDCVIIDNDTTLAEPF
jgi:hypothetical protein